MWRQKIGEQPMAALPAQGLFAGCIWITVIIIFMEGLTERCDDRLNDELGQRGDCSEAGSMGQDYVSNKVLSSICGLSGAV